MQARILFLLSLSIFAGSAAAAAPSAKRSEAAVPPPGSAAPASPYAPNIGGEPPHIVMVTIGKEEVTMKDYLGYLQANMQRAEQDTTPGGKAVIVKAMVSDRIIREQILKEGLVPKTQADDDQAMLEAYRKLAQMHFPPPPPPSEEEARAYYAAHRNDYGIPVMWRLSQIQFRSSHGTSSGPYENKTAAKEKAEAALQRIQKGDDFGKVAAELSENSDARIRRGDLGFLPMAGLPLSTEVLAGMKLNQPTGVVETPSGYEILMKTDERPERISPFEQVKDRVVKKMIAEGQAKEKDAYLAEVTRDTPVVVVVDYLKPYFPNGMFGSGPADASGAPSP